MKKLNRVFLIDDEEANSFLNQRLFRKLGYQGEFQVFRNGQLAFDYLRQVNQNPDLLLPDLILLDVNMPVMDGFEFIELYQTLPAEAQNKMVLVLLSTSAHPTDTGKARELNVPYLSKPLTAANLQPLLQQHFLPVI